MLNKSQLDAILILGFQYHPLVKLMSCQACRDIEDKRSEPHVVRKCKSCGRTMYMQEKTKDGYGLRIRDGDSLVFPLSHLKLSLNPLETSATLFRPGVEWFTEHIFLDSILHKRDSFVEDLQSAQAVFEKRLESSNLFDGIDLDSDGGQEDALAILQEHAKSLEWWQYGVAAWYQSASHAIQRGDATDAAWSMACAERFRSMSIFKEQLEEVVWMGMSARRVIDLLRILQGNTSNGNEAFWQSTFSQHTYALSQIFSFPVIWLQREAYVGGKRIDGKGARKVDFLLSHELSREAAIVELKTPITPLLGRKYRQVFGPSSELSGAIAQTLDYRQKLITEMKTLTGSEEFNIAPIQPRCVLIAGNSKSELTSSAKRNSFELYRSQLKDIEIVTFDELLRKIQALAKLFNLEACDANEGQSNSLD